MSTNQQLTNQPTHDNQLTHDNPWQQEFEFDKVKLEFELLPKTLTQIKIKT